MTALTHGGATTLVASTLLMLLVLAVRRPVRHWAGPRLGYALWVLPAARLVLPGLPAIGLKLPAGPAALPLFVGPVGGAPGATSLPGGDLLLAIWFAGAVAVFVTYAVRHVVFCRRLRTTGTAAGRRDGISVIAADVTGPLAFGVVRRVIAVPRDFDRTFVPHERDLALAHEAAHHARGDLIANWVSLVVLAAHWWNPVAWVASRAFRDDQEFAADAAVLAAGGDDTRADYARVLAKAAGVGALFACTLTRANLKGRLMMLAYPIHSRRRLAVGAAALALGGGAALAATATPAASGGQLVTIGVKPDGAGGYALIAGATAVAPGAPLPGGATLPADFTGSGGCDVTAAAKPHAMVIKGVGKTRTYTVSCASAGPVAIRATLAEQLASIKAMRTSIAAQPTSAVFPETERRHALGAVDRSIAEVEATLATAS